MEILGILGTCLIVSAFAMNGEKRIRILDTAGAALFVAYGITISSFSTILLNAVLIAIQIYKLARLK